MMNKVYTECRDRKQHLFNCEAYQKFSTMITHTQMDRREPRCNIPAASKCVKTGSLTKWVPRNCQLSLMRFTKLKTKYYKQPNLAYCLIFKRNNSTIVMCVCVCMLAYIYMYHHMQKNAYECKYISVMSTLLSCGSLFFLLCFCCKCSHI